MQVLGHLVQVALFETFICPNTCLNQLTHTLQNKGGHGTSPAHGTPRALLSTLTSHGTLLSTLTSHGTLLSTLRNLQVNHVHFLSHPLITPVMHCLSSSLLAIIIITDLITQLIARINNMKSSLNNS
jgi:hypothetical protein